MDDQQFRQLPNYFGLSWRGYRKVRKGVIKRIRRHMGGMGCHNMAAYLIELGNNEDARHICERLMTVSISRFFRDQKLWEILKNEIVIQLKDGIIWKNHNLLNDAPSPQFDLIFLRNNLLSYYKDAIKMSALKKVTNSLSDNGFLIIGSHEKLPSENRDFLSMTQLSYVFRKG